MAFVESLWGGRSYEVLALHLPIFDCWLILTGVFVRRFNMTVSSLTIAFKVTSAFWNVGPVAGNYQRVGWHRRGIIMTIMVWAGVRANWRSLLLRHKERSEGEVSGRDRSFWYESGNPLDLEKSSKDWALSSYGFLR